MLISARKQLLETAALDARLAAETIDITLPGPQPAGRQPAPGNPYAGAY